LADAALTGNFSRCKKMPEVGNTRWNQMCHAYTYYNKIL
jgi:hypothetical protein